MSCHVMSCHRLLAGLTSKTTKPKSVGPKAIGATSVLIPRAGWRLKACGCLCSKQTLDESRPLEQAGRSSCRGFSQRRPLLSSQALAKELQRPRSKASRGMARFTLKEKVAAVPLRGSLEVSSSPPPKAPAQQNWSQVGARGSAKSSFPTNKASPRTWGYAEAWGKLPTSSAAGLGSATWPALARVRRQLVEHEDGHQVHGVRA